LINSNDTTSNALAAPAGKLFDARRSRTEAAAAYPLVTESQIQFRQ
jgi:hypothetical protein